jgi:cell wall-associated NlpC family hydrolase
LATTEFGDRPTAFKTGRRRASVIGVVAALSLSLLWTGSAMADPDTPATSDQAQQAYLDSSQQAGALNEEVLVAQQNEQAAGAAVTAATAQVGTATAAAADAKQRAAAADQEAAGYQAKVDAFANASFRGARLSQMSVLLTADSAEDFLDQVSSLDRVAADTQQTLTAAVAAKTAAAQAQTDATATQAAAEKAKADADAAQVSAQQATADVTTRKADLDAEAARYKALYESLSAQERQAAEAAADAANAAANAAAAAAPADAAPAAANRSEVRAPIADDPAPAPAAEPSAAQAAPSEEPASAPAGNSAAARAVAAALSKEGARYVFGAAGPSSFDCSGLTSWAWAQAGVSIPRTSGGQAGLPTVPLSELQPGDLVTYYSPVHHVAMYIGNGQIIHASTESKPVYITTVSGGGPNATGHRVTG